MKVGSSLKQLNNPCHVTVNKNGSIFVVDCNEGRKLFQLLNNPQQLTVNYKGSILVDCNGGRKLFKQLNNPQ